MGCLPLLMLTLMGTVWSIDWTQLPALPELQQHGDRMALDWLSVAMLLRYEPGIVSTEQLMQAWGVGQSTVSRRLAALQAAGLLDVSSGHGAYAVHGLEVA